MVLSTISCGRVQLLSGLVFSQSRGELFVKGGLAVARLIAVCRPETGAVRSQHLIAQGDVSVLIQAKLKFGVCDDDAFAQSVLGAFFIEAMV